MKRLLAVAAVLAVGAASAHAQNLLTNGNLDVTYQQLITDVAPPGSGPEDFFLPKPASGSTKAREPSPVPIEDELSSEPWAGPAPTPVTTGGASSDDWAVFFKPFSGNVSPPGLNGPATGHLYQDKPATPGLRYNLTGWAGAEPYPMP